MAAHRFLLIDDHQIVREGVRAMIQYVPDWSVVGEAEDGIDGIRLALTLKPDVIVTDMMMPGVNGLEVTRRLRSAAFPGVIVLLSAHAGDELMQSAKEVGVNLVLSKDTGFSYFTTSIQHLLAHPTVVAPVVGPETAGFGLDKLTPREQEVLKHVASGAPPKEIAQTLGISPKTLDVHRSRIMRKLQASGTADLTRIAVRAGLTSL